MGTGGSESAGGPQALTARGRHSRLHWQAHSGWHWQPAPAAAPPFSLGRRGPERPAQWPARAASPGQPNPRMDVEARSLLGLIIVIRPMWRHQAAQMSGIALWLPLSAALWLGAAAMIMIMSVSYAWSRDQPP